MRAADPVQRKPEREQRSAVLHRRNAGDSPEVGLLRYALASDNLLFQGGVLCVGAPRRRTPLQMSGGNSGATDCSGAYSFDFRARIQSGVDSELVAGAEVFAQYWQRDPLAAFGVGLTAAVAFHIAP